MRFVTVSYCGGTIAFPQVDLDMSRISVPVIAYYPELVLYLVGFLVIYCLEGYQTVFVLFF